MSTKLGRLLDKNFETVNHIDNNKINDNINNLQILTNSDNIKKSSKGRNIKEYTCPVCKSSFKREVRQVIYKKSKYPPTCSRSCGGKVSYIGL
jgi:transposase-like protein